MKSNYTFLSSSRTLALATLFAFTGGSHAAVITINGDTAAGLATDTSNFYTTVGESADFTENFNSFNDGDNLATINGGASGFSITTLTGSDVSISDGTNTGGSGTGTISGGDGVGLLFDDGGPGQSARFTFASPVDYFSFTDHDHPGVVDITIEFVGGSTQLLDISDTTGGNGIEFIGVFRNDGPNQIESFVFSQTGETDGLLVDDLQWGSVTPVPEPSSTALLGLGGLALILRRRR
jgi:hypothetical protein